MKFQKHGNGNGLDDLYILPETDAERKATIAFLRGKKISYTLERSDVEKQDWYGKTFILAYFAEALEAELATREATWTNFTKIKIKK